jgi:hypothetical protein
MSLALTFLVHLLLLTYIAVLITSGSIRPVVLFFLSEQFWPELYPYELGVIYLGPQVGPWPFGTAVGKAAPPYYSIQMSDPGTTFLYIP